MTEALHRACAQLRFAEGLRRGSNEARAEAAVQEAAALSSLLGIQIPPTRIRELTMAPEQATDPGERAALGVWRATWSLLDSLPPLNARPERKPPSPWPAVVAGWHRDLNSFLVAAGDIDSAEVGIPTSLTAMRSLTGGGDATMRAATVWKAFVDDPPFEYGSVVLGALAAKRILALSGVEPTGVCVLGVVAGREPGRVQSEQKWDDFFVQSVIDGCDFGQRIARSVQAGQTL